MDIDSIHSNIHTTAGMNCDESSNTSDTSHTMDLSHIQSINYDNIPLSNVSHQSPIINYNEFNNYIDTITNIKSHKSLNLLQTRHCIITAYWYLKSTNNHINNKNNIIFNAYSLE
eukprot:521943_1